MRIETGQGTIPLKTLVSVWTISAIISLPGLGISPILGSLTKIFPTATELEIEMLSSIPSLLIIPFILLSGYLSVGYDKIKVLVVGLVIFLVSGGLCLFVDSITVLIVLSAVLGIGAGMVIPLSTGFIAEFFVGRHRTSQLGISSSIANLSLVVATVATGWLAQIDWHLPFVVYLFPVFALIMARFLKSPKVQFDKGRVASPTVTPDAAPSAADGDPQGDVIVAPGKNYNKRALVEVMLLYLAAGYFAVIVALNLSFVILERKMGSSVSGVLIAVFFLSIMAPGFFMNRLKDVFGRFVIGICMLSISLGLLLIAVKSSIVILGLGVVLIGIGYGFIQPFVYDKATRTSRADKTIVTLAYVMSVNYLTIIVAPFITNSLNGLFGASQSASAIFAIGSPIALALAVWAFLKYRRFVFSVR